MTALPTCKNCVLEKQPCERRETVRQSIKGLGITSAKLRCAERVPLFSPGQRVTVTWPVVIDEEWLREANLESWPATVVKEVRPRFLIKVDDVLSDYETPASEFLKNASLYAKVPAAKLAPLDEPVQTVCDACGRVGNDPVGVGGCCGYAGIGASGFRPYGCAAVKPHEGINR